MRTRPGFQVRRIRSSLSWNGGSEQIPSTWKPDLVRIGGLSMTFQNQLMYWYNDIVY